jgi:hypothetical protein
MIYPGLFGLFAAVWYYLRYPPLRKKVIQAVWNKYDDIVNGIQYFDVQT